MKREYRREMITSEKHCDNLLQILKYRGLL